MIKKKGKRRIKKDREGSIPEETEADVELYQGESI